MLANRPFNADVATLPLPEGSRVHLLGVDADVASEYGVVVDEQRDADMTIMRVAAPFEPRVGAFGSMFHSGSLEFPPDEHARITAALTARPTVLDVFLDRLVAYAFYTVLHDAAHKAISGRNSRFAWLDTLCGNIASVPIQLEFRGHTTSHLQHHAHTNDPFADPDAVAAGPAWQLPIKWMAGNIITVVGAMPFGAPVAQSILDKFRPADAPAPNDRPVAGQQRSRRLDQILLLIVIASIPLGLFVPVFFLVWLPGRLGSLILFRFFVWLPHVPYERTERFLNTRVTTFVGSTVLLLHQDRHLIHHLYPNVPWYRYRAVFNEVRPLLEAEGSVIEGRESSPHRPIRLTCPSNI